MKSFVLFAALVWSSVAGLAQAQQSPVVVELFTSQGCSSCPPADALLRQMAGREDVIPLALHVDYWDYIGWKDAFANPAYTERQKRYARVLRSRVVYTPQMIIHGQHDVIGNRVKDVADLIAQHASTPAPVTLTVQRDGDVLKVSAKSVQQVGAADLILIRYLDESAVDIKRGENAGRTLVYSHIVTDWQPVARWNGRGDFTFSGKILGDAPAVVLMQSKGQGAVLAAARLR